MSLQQTLLATAGPVTAWSYSRLAMWEQCPFAFKCKNIDKIKEEQSPAMARGDRIHKIAESFVMSPAAGDGYVLPAESDLPPELRKFARLMMELQRMPADIKVVEQQWGFSKNWRATGWFGNETWLRVKIDVGVVYPDCTADMIDHKTGKKYDNHGDQLELNSLALMCRFPQVGHVTARNWYLDSGEEMVLEFDQSDKSDFMAKWEARVAPYFADRMFAPKPGNYCNRCAYSRSKNGPCKFG